MEINVTKSDGMKVRGFSFSLFHLPIFLTGLSNTPCIPPRRLDRVRQSRWYSITYLIQVESVLCSVSGEIKGRI